MISEIWSTTDRILSYFGPFFVLLHPLPLKNPKNQNFEKMKKKKKKKNKKKKKKTGDIILHKCTINDNHMIYGS